MKSALVFVLGLGLGCGTDPEQRGLCVEYPIDSGTITFAPCVAEGDGKCSALLPDGLYTVGALDETMTETECVG